MYVHLPHSKTLTKHQTSRSIRPYIMGCLCSYKHSTMAYVYVSKRTTKNVCTYIREYIADEEGAL